MNVKDHQSLSNICPACGETVLIENDQSSSFICANCGFLVSDDSWVN